MSPNIIRPRPEVSRQTLAALNLLAFAWHTVLDLLEPSRQAAREAGKRTSFFARTLMLTADLLSALL
jgi:hypothetical protein